MHALATFAAKDAPDDFWTTFFFLYEEPIGLFFIAEGVSFDFKQSKNFLQILLFLLKVLERSYC